MASKKEDCVIYHKEFVDGADKVEVGKKGLATLIEFNKKRNDSDLYDYLTSIANSENCKIKVHKNCIILEQCRKRGDEWATEVETRLNGCFDLLAADAVYHKLCHSHFMLNRKCPSSSHVSESKRGRKPDAALLEYYEMLCLWLENEAEEELYTLHELALKMSELADGDDTYSTRWLKQKLIDRYEDLMYFAEIDGRPNIVCFRTTTSSIINEKWYNDRKTKVEDEAERIVETAAKIILSEIRAIEYNMEKYPSIEDISNLDENKSIIPHCLQRFLKVLVKSSVKQNSIGQCLLYAVRPRSIIPLIPFGLGVEIDHVIGSK